MPCVREPVLGHAKKPRRLGTDGDVVEPAPSDRKHVGEEVLSVVPVAHDVTTAQVPVKGIAVFTYEPRESRLAVRLGHDPHLRQPAASLCPCRQVPTTFHNDLAGPRSPNPALRI